MVDSINEKEVFDTLRNKLSTPVVCDTLDMLGVREQGMRAEIRPIYQEAIVVGRAHPVLAVDIYNVADESFDKINNVIESLKTNDVLIIGGSSSMRSALFGELLSTAAQVRGASGLVCNGALRDVGQIADLKFPTFAAGVRMSDPIGRMRIIDDGCPVNCGGVLVKPGDIVFGDMNGVVVIPKELVREVIPLALKRVADEDLVRSKLLKGEKLQRAFDAVFKHE